MEKFFSEKGDAMGPKSEFTGSSGKDKKLPDMYDTSKPEQEFGSKKKKGSMGSMPKSKAY